MGCALSPAPAPHRRLNLLHFSCREAQGGAHDGDLPMYCCGSADQIRHRWATQSCHNQPGFENVIIGMVNKFTRTPLRQRIAMVTDQKSLGARKVSIRHWGTSPSRDPWHGTAVGPASQGEELGLEVQRGS